jgi:hypothetical protein
VNRGERVGVGPIHAHARKPPNDFGSRGDGNERRARHWEGENGCEDNDANRILVAALRAATRSNWDRFPIAGSHL